MTRIRAHLLSTTGLGVSGCKTPNSNHKNLALEQAKAAMKKRTELKKRRELERALEAEAARQKRAKLS